MTTNFFSTLSFVVVFGYGIWIRDKHPGSATLAVAVGTFTSVFKYNILLISHITEVSGSGSLESVIEITDRMSGSVV